MYHILNTRLLALVALLAIGGGLRADIIIRAGPVTVRVGHGVSVDVSPRVCPPGVPSMPPAVPVGVPLLPPDGVPLEIAPPAPPVPLPGDDTTRKVSEKRQSTQTIYDFATSFKPSAGTHEAVVVHPYTNTPVKVSFTLPEGTPTVKIKGGLRRAVEFNYGNRGVEVWFYRDGRVLVKN
jgi:hypothetical protein